MRRSMTDHNAAFDNELRSSNPVAFFCDSRIDAAPADARPRDYQREPNGSKRCRHTYSTVSDTSVPRFHRDPRSAAVVIWLELLMRLPPFQLVDWFSAAEGRFDISLSHSDCEPLSVFDLLGRNELAEFADFPLGYGTFACLTELRRVVARQYETIQPDDVLVFSGASEAIYTFMRTTLNPGDQVVVQAPLFNTLHAIARSIGCEFTEWHAANETTCEYDVLALADLCGERMKLIVFNFPHNPTGQTISEEDLRVIVETARRSDAFVFSDEQFRLLEIPGSSPLPAACDLYEKAVSVAGVSKTHGLGGLRIGWLATRCRRIIEAAREYRFYTTEMTNTPCQYLASRALDRGDEILHRNRSRIAANVERLCLFAEQQHGKLVFHPPKAGTMAVVEQRTPLTSVELCKRLLDAERVFLVPGGVIGMSDRLLRLGLGRDDFAEGLARFGDFLRRESL
jgi:aspartate/methionine/tyrosine aminotransferase